MLRALNYPYPRLAQAVAFLDGKPFPLEVHPRRIKIGSTNINIWLAKQNLPELDELTPVLAYGSNGSPVQLKRKFPKGVIISIPAELLNFDVVRSAHFSSYGTIPANLAPSFGIRTEISLLFLSKPMLARLHVSEAKDTNYKFIEFQTERIQTTYQLQSNPWVYVSMHGNLLLDGQPIAFSEIATTNRQLPEMAQPQLLKRVHDEICPSRNFKEWMLHLTRDRDYRRQMNATIRAFGRS